MSARKNNPDYEPFTINTRDGVKQTYYRLKKNAKKPKKNVGTPEKRRGGFKAPKATSPSVVGQLNVPPTITSSMAEANISNYQAGKAQSNAMLNIDNITRLSGRAREKIQNEAKAPQQVAKIKKRSRPNPNPGGGDGRT